MTNRILGYLFFLNSFYLSFLYFQLLWQSQYHVDAAKIQLYGYLVLAIFFVYPAFIFLNVIFTNEAKVNFFQKIILVLMPVLGAIGYFYAFDLYKEKDVSIGYGLTFLQYLLMVIFKKNKEQQFQIAGIYAIKSIIWLFTLVFSFVFFLFKDDEALQKVFFGAVFYFFMGIIDFIIANFEMIWKYRNYFYNKKKKVE